MIKVEIESALRRKAKALVERDRVFFERFIHPDFRYVSASGFEATSPAISKAFVGSVA